MKIHRLQVVILLALAGLVACSSVVELTNDNFKYVDKGTWLVKFYAPWCQHCKKLAPVWEEVASHYAKSNPNIKVAKVDCEAQSDVCNTANIEGYPTIKYYMHGIQKNYAGGRKKHDFINYVHKMSKPATVELTKETASKAYQQENPAFVLVNAGEEAKKVYVELANHMLELESPDFYILNDKSLGGEHFKDIPDQSIVVFREGNRDVYKGKIELEPLLEWAQHFRFPYVSKYSEATFEALTSSDKLLVLAVTDKIDLEEEKFAEDFKVVAKKRANERKYVFASLDALQYERYAASFGAVPETLPTVVVIDYSNEIHFIDPEIKFNSPDKIENFLKEIEAGNVKWQTWSYSAFIAKKINKFNKFVWNWIQANVLIFAIGSTISLILMIYVCCLPATSTPSSPAKKTK